MSLIKSTGNMYGFITHQWNPIKGRCTFRCSYCYMNRFKLNKIRFCESELNTNLGNGNFIFICSGTDIHCQIGFNIQKIADYCKQFNNKYLWQSKDPKKFLYYSLPRNSTIATTIESNRWYPGVSEAPGVYERISGIMKLKAKGHKVLITIEPIIDFDTDMFLKLLKEIKPDMIAIGADSGNNNLPEPSQTKIRYLITECKKFTFVYIKDNLKRLFI